MNGEPEGLRTLFQSAEYLKQLGKVRLVEWPEGLVLWVGGEIAWKSWGSDMTVKLSVDASAAVAAMVDYESTLSSAARSVIEERRRQINVEGWTPKHDDAHQRGEMAGAAACYALTNVQHWGAPQAAASLWPWAEKWWKPSSIRRNLVKAGALIIAEIERLDRQADQP